MSSDDAEGWSWSDGFIATWLAVQILLPVGYYARAAAAPAEGAERAAIYDERFSWRMFSPVRMLRCTVDYTIDGSGPANLERYIHTAWITLLKRGRTDVIEAVNTTLCSRDDIESVKLDLTCREADGTYVVIVPADQEWCE